MPTVADYFNFGMTSENSFWIDAGMDFSEVDIKYLYQMARLLMLNNFSSESLYGTYILRQPLDLNNEVTEMESTTFSNTSVVNAI